MDEGKRQLHFDTLAAQAGLRVRVGDTISTSPPIDPSTTYTGASIEDVHMALGPNPQGFAYGRNANPTVAALETALARLYGTDDVVAFGSGMAAIHAALTGLQLWPGDRILASHDLYGVTRGFFAQLGQHEIETEYIDVYNPAATRKALETSRPRVFYFETITNPLLRVPDAAALIEAAHAVGSTVIIDNTFATPYLFRPTELGADLVVDSATKYIAGHGDVTAGVIAGTAASLQPMRTVRTTMGGVLSPFEAWLAMRGVRTLPLRMQRQCANAFELARWLDAEPWVESVYYPGLPHHPHHACAAQQFGGIFGGMVAFDLAGNRERALAFINALELITAGTSLGDVETLVLYPPLSSHRTLNEEQLAQAGITPGLIRMSVGIEHVEDLRHDLEAAARRVGLIEEAR